MQRSRVKDMLTIYFRDFKLAFIGILKKIFCCCCLVTIKHFLLKSQLYSVGRKLSQNSLFISWRQKKYRNFFFGATPAAHKQHFWTPQSNKLVKTEDEKTLFLFNQSFQKAFRIVVEP